MTIYLKGDSEASLDYSCAMVVPRDNGRAGRLAVLAEVAGRCFSVQTREPAKSLSDRAWTAMIASGQAPIPRPPPHQPSIPR
ncbi:MAG: hypothetical protein ACYDEY_04130 [Acidimicrobiales bacterium]